MQTIKAILVPVDFTNLSLNAFRYALRLADGLRAKVDVMYCIPPTTDGFGEAGVSLNLLASLQESARLNMDTFFREGLAAEQSALAFPPAVETYIETGDLRQAIQRMVKRNAYNLVVMGTHGGDSSWDKFWGTNTSFLVSKAPCPVLIIPAGASYVAPQKIGYATDLRHVDAMRAGHLLQVLRPAFQPRLHFIHVRGREAQEGAADDAYDMDLLRKVFGGTEGDQEPEFSTLRGEDVVASLFTFAAEKSLDLLVMYRPDRSWASRIFGGSHTRKAALYTDLPLLVFGRNDLN